MGEEQIGKDEVQKLIDGLSKEAKEENLIRNEYIEMIGRLQISIAGKTKAVEVLTTLIQVKDSQKKKKKGK